MVTVTSPRGSCVLSSAVRFASRRVVRVGKAQLKMEVAGGSDCPVYFTGDGARKDEDGFFWVMGRVDDVVNVAGPVSLRAAL